MEEIRELRRRGIEVLPCSARAVRETSFDSTLQDFCRQTIFLQPLRPAIGLRALGTCCSRLPRILDLLRPILLSLKESPARRVRAIAHTLLGAYYAELLRGRGIQHIHAHHGYFSSWIAMVAARLLGVSFSLTLHGSDLLLHPAYLETKLRECSFCLTVSEFNKKYILAHYPEIDPQKILVQRIGVPTPSETAIPAVRPDSVFTILSVGRLHSVKNHTFLIRACHLLRARGVRFCCAIVGEGPERKTLEALIRELKLEADVQLVGHVPHHEIGAYYERSDLVVLTSHSEGIPLVLMEAMAASKLVLAPRITGIPELVIHGKTGFLYSPGQLEEFVSKLLEISQSLSDHAPIRQAARAHVEMHFDQQMNLAQFADLFLKRLDLYSRRCRDEDLVLQQI
jgi:glycosyltransferase involved in cell wall biosynthesis